MKINLSNTATPVLFAAPKKGSVEVAAYTAASGDRLISLASQTPFSPIDGEQMQSVSSRKEKITARQIRDAFVPVGTCPSCHSHLVASASMADAIEVSGSDIHCPVCTAHITPSIDIAKLTRALAAEFNADDDVDTDDVDVDNGVEDDAGVPDGDDDADDVGEDEDYDEDYGDDDEDADVDSDEVAKLRRAKRKLAKAADEDGEVSPDEVTLDDDGDGEDDDFGGIGDDDDADYDEESSRAIAAAVRRRKAAKRKVANASFDEMGEPVEDIDVEGENPRQGGDVLNDGDEEDVLKEGQEDIEKAALQLRREIAKRKRARMAKASDDVEGLEGEAPRDDGDPLDDGDEDDLRLEGENAPDPDVVAALAKYVRSEYKRRGLAYPATAGQNGIAGKPTEKAGVTSVLEAAKDRLRSTARDIDGNRKVKSRAATAAEGLVDPLGLENNLETDEDVEGDRLVDVAPGTGADVPEDLDNLGDTETPGTEALSGDECMDEDDDGVCDDAEAVNPDDGEESIAGDSLVDWRNAKIEIIASSGSDDRWIMSGGNPVAKLVRSKASASVTAIWDTDTLTASFMHVARTGLNSTDAREFGFTPIRYRVTGSEAIRTAMRRSAELSTENAQNLVNRSVARYQQAVKVAMLAAVKGVYPDLKNPVRDRLAADLAKLGVHEPRSIVDKAFASCVDELVTGVFAHADELASKPDAARNEVAKFVAKAAFQSRHVDPSVELSEALVKGNQVPVVPVRQASLASEKPVADHASMVRRAIRSIGK